MAPISKSSSQSPVAASYQNLGRLLISWTVLFMAGGAAGYGGSALLASLFAGSRLPFVGLVLPLGVLTVGVALGAVQRKLLASQVNVTARWPWMTGMGMAVGLLLLVAINTGTAAFVADWSEMSRLTVFLGGAGLAGALASLGQWLILRPILPKHQWWLMANGVGWLMAWIGVLATGLALGGGEPLPATAARWGDALILGAVAGFIIGFEQGVALVGLLAQRVWEARNATQPLESGKLN